LRLSGNTDREQTAQGDRQREIVQKRGIKRKKKGKKGRLFLLHRHLDKSNFVGFLPL